jgi:sugar phosphate isomerase/epimerase
MELLFSTAPFFRRSLQEAFGLISEAGYEAAEVMVSHDPATQNPSAINRAAERAGLRVGVVHAPFLVLTRKVFGVEPIEKIRKTVELAGEVGAHTVVAHPPYRWQRSYRDWLSNGMLELSAESGVRVAIENMFPLRLGTQRGVRMHHGQELEALRRYPDLVLDTSHAAVSGMDLSQATAVYAERLKHIHLSNNAGRGWDSHLPVYLGVLPIDAFLRSMSDDGYAGSISLEIDLRPYFGDEAELREVLARNREFCETRFASGATSP